MTWVRLDDSMFDHPKIVGLSDKAFRAHIGALCYCARHLTDGHIPAATARKLATKTVRNRLVSARIWVENQELGGYTIHDYAEYQPTREKVVAERKKTADRVTRWRERNGVTNGVGNGVRTPAPVPVPLSSTPTVVVDRGISTPGERILPKALQRILLDEIRDQLTAAQAETVAKAWRTNDHELRQSMADVEKANNPVAYLVKTAGRIAS